MSNVHVTGDRRKEESKREVDCTWTRRRQRALREIYFYKRDCTY
jgi:hypothetical protein